MAKLLLYTAVKQVANQKGESIAHIERSLRLPNGIISKWDHSIPRADTFQKVADHLDVASHHLLNMGRDLYEKHLEEEKKKLEYENDEIKTVLFNLIKNVEALSKQKGKSIRQVGINSVIGETSIYRWDKNEPKLSTIMKVANYLGVDYKTLLFGRKKEDKK